MIVIDTKTQSCASSVSALFHIRALYVCPFHQERNAFVRKRALESLSKQKENLDAQKKKIERLLAAQIRIDVEPSVAYK